MPDWSSFQREIGGDERSPSNCRTAVDTDNRAKTEKDALLILKSAAAEVRSEVRSVTERDLGAIPDYTFLESHYKIQNPRADR